LGLWVRIYYSSLELVEDRVSVRGYDLGLDYGYLFVLFFITHEVAKTQANTCTEPNNDLNHTVY